MKFMLYVLSRVLALGTAVEHPKWGHSKHTCEPNTHAHTVTQLHWRVFTQVMMALRSIQPNNYSTKMFTWTWGKERGRSLLLSDALHALHMQQAVKCTTRCDTTQTRCNMFRNLLEYFPPLSCSRTHPLARTERN